MSRRRVLDWYLPLLSGALAVAVLGPGFLLALTVRIGEPLGPAPAAAAIRPRVGALHVVALGDSITAGTGDGNRGYAARAVEALRRRELEVTFTNLAVPGDETADLLRRMAAAHTREEIARANLLLVSIGGNDLTHSMRGQTAAADDKDKDDDQEALRSARANLQEIVGQLRALNPRAAIRLVGLYNPFEVLPAEETNARAHLLEWNLAIERAALTDRETLAIPIMDLFADRPDRLAGDSFHPGPRGHDAIASRVLSSLREAER